MTKYSFAGDTFADWILPLELIGDWHHLLQEFGQVVIHHADHASSDFNFHSYLVECDGDFAILYREENPADPFMVGDPEIEFGLPADDWREQIEMEAA